MQLVPSLALHDTMKHVQSQVATVGFGACMGMPGFLLATGQKVSYGSEYEALQQSLAVYLPLMERKALVHKFAVLPEKNP